jgi:hypothetical protein
MADIMNRPLVASGVTLTRLWVRGYTWGVADRVGSARRDEIDSDMWEMLNDRDDHVPVPSATVVFLRWLAGIPADLAWRVDQFSLEQQLAVRRVLAFGAALALVALLWTASFVSFNGRPEVATCAGHVAAPYDTAALRLGVMRCAGAFFAARR